MVTVGIDCGAKNTKTVILKDGEIVGKAVTATGFEQSEAVARSLAEALTSAGVTREDVDRIAGTGSGSGSIREADMTVNDIKAMAFAARFFCNTARTVVDVGAEEGRAVAIGAGVDVEDFAVNEKCAAGTGAFIDAMARALQTPIEEMGPLALLSNESIPMNAQCAIFAESEVVGLIHAKRSKEDVSRAVHDAMAVRVASMVRRVGVRPDVVMIGGVGRNPGFVHSLKRELEIERILVPDNPEYGPAIGAAAAAADERT